MKKGKVKTYVIDNNGNYKLLDEFEEKAVFKESILPEELPNKINEALHDNPFLLINNEQIRNQIESIEEFYINQENNEIKLNEIIRDDSINKKQKKHILNEQFKIWKKESIEVLNTIADENEKQFTKTKPEKFKIINDVNIFFLIVSLILSLTMISNIFNFIQKNVLTTIIIVITIIFVILSFVLTFIQSDKIKKYDTCVKEHFQQLRLYTNKSTKQIKRNYKKLKKYYSNKYKNNMFLKEPYNISNIYIDMKTYNDLKNDNKNILETYNIILKEQEGLNIYYNIPRFSSYFLMIINSGYFIIMLLIYLYKLIFTKGE